VILATDMDTSIFNPVILSEFMFGVASGINSTVVMEYLMKFLGNQFHKYVSIVQIFETSMSLIIPIGAKLCSNPISLFHMENLCKVGAILSIMSGLIAASFLVDFPNRKEDINNLKWIG
jgi:uncharacterized membrane protein